MNRQQRRGAKAQKKALKVGDILHTKLIFAKMRDGSNAVFWVQISENMSDEDAMKQEWHGPFNTEEEARTNSEVVLLGPDCKVTEGGMWDPAWSKPQ